MFPNRMRMSFVGNIKRSEFQPPCRGMTALLQTHGLSPSFFPCILSEPAGFDVSLDGCLDFCVLFQSWPGEFSDSAILTLKRCSPLAPIILLAGCGCEGEARTGKIPSGVFRLYAHQWDEYYATEFTQLLAKKPSVFSLPATFEAEEVVLWQSRPDKGFKEPIHSSLQGRSKLH